MEKKPLNADEIRQIDDQRRVGVEGTLYEVLGVKPGCALADIETAYHDVARLWHPDRFYSRDIGEYAPVIEENFVTATRAFRTLRDPAKRGAYDRELEATGRLVIETPEETASIHQFVPVAPKLVRPPPPPPPAAPKYGAPPAVKKIKEELERQLSRAKMYFESGKEDFDAGRYVKAESTLYLATKFDPRNPEYEALHKRATARAQEIRVRQWILQAEAEEGFARVREAIVLYRKAIECEPAYGSPYFRLANLIRTYEGDDHAAVVLYRKAVQKEPQNVTYRLALAEHYVNLNLLTNARREVAMALETDSGNEAARALQKKLKG